MENVHTDIMALIERPAHLIGEYHISIKEGVIIANETKRLLKETILLRQVLIEMKLHLDDEYG